VYDAEAEVDQFSSRLLTRLTWRDPSSLTSSLSLDSAMVSKLRAVVLRTLHPYPATPRQVSRPGVRLRPVIVVHMQSFADKLVEVVSMEDDYVWIHDYHLLVLPSLLRKRLFRVRCGLFLHSPFPSSEIFRTFPKRDELLRSILNVDLVGAQLLSFSLLIHPGLAPDKAPAICFRLRHSPSTIPVFSQWSAQGSHVCLSLI